MDYTDGTRQGREKAWRAFRQFTEAHVPALRLALQSSDRDRVIAAGGALSCMEDDASVDLLIDALNGKTSLDRRFASIALCIRIQEQEWQTHDIALLIIDNLALLSGKTPDIPHIENFLEDFYTETKKCPLIVGFMKTSEWLYLKQLTDVDNRHFLEFFQPSKVQLNPFSYVEIEKLLVKRLQATKTEKTSSDLLYPFSQRILRHISY